VFKKRRQFSEIEGDDEGEDEFVETGDRYPETVSE